jgi:hypothetical protein
MPTAEAGRAHGCVISEIRSDWRPIKKPHQAVPLRGSISQPCLETLHCYFTPAKLGDLLLTLDSVSYRKHLTRFYRFVF